MNHQLDPSRFDSGRFDSSSYNRSQPEYYISTLSDEELALFSDAQFQVVYRLLREAIPRPSSKIIDLRFTIKLIVDTFYIVVFVGKNKRNNVRSDSAGSGNKFLNILLAAFLLVVVNVAITLSALLAIYLVKSSLGINLFSRSLKDYVLYLFS